MPLRLPVETEDTVWVVFWLDCCDHGGNKLYSEARGISGELIQDLISESIEDLTRIWDRILIRFQWLGGNDLAYIARSMEQFARATGFDVCMTPFTALNPTVW